MIARSVFFTTLTLAVLVASNVTAAASARSKVGAHNAHPGKLQVNCETAKLGNFDPFSDGTRSGTADPRTESAKLENFDTFGDGLHTTVPRNFR
ncbi:hypothetical protein [Cupriavidus necator]|uniref:hypothetical protein n=1 Tax=Cupriavidus necator TaxID=106590 RepID=UPI00339D8E3C